MEPDKTAPKPETARAKLRAQARQRRQARAARREDILELVLSGFDRALIAKRLGLSLATVRREVDRALDGRRPDAPDRYARLQSERLTKALRAVDDAIERGDLAAVEPLVKLMGALDRYQGLAASLAPAAPVRLARVKPPALTHDAAPVVEWEGAAEGVAEKGG